MREINRAQYLRGTKTWSTRNWFVFGGVAATLLIGVSSVFLFPGTVEKLQQKTQEDRKAREEKRDRLRAIQQHRRELSQTQAENKG